MQYLTICHLFSNTIIMLHQTVKCYLCLFLKGLLSTEKM